MTNTTARDRYVLAVLSASGGEPWTPVQVQKMFFLLDERIPRDIEGPRFDFRPYDYGPFDAAVYHEIGVLRKAGKASVDTDRVRSYRLTPTGQREGERALQELPKSAQDYIRKLSAWVRALSFPQLVSAVYSEFPEMRAKSVFRR
jgi:hypothetical protein